MRFFKSLSLLHRRSKSDTALAAHRPSVETNTGPVTPRSTDGFPAQSSVFFFKCRLLDLELENRHLAWSNASLALQYTSTEAELRRTMSELYAEMHRNVRFQRQAQKDRDIILNLRQISEQYLQFLQTFPDIAHAFDEFYSQNLPNDHITPPVMSTSENGVQVTGSKLPALLPDGGPKDIQQYTTALQIIIKTRQELRSCKKVALFWKRKAKATPESAALITPSPSDISELPETLTQERQDAVAVLQQKRKMMANHRAPSLTPSSLQHVAASAIHSTGVPSTRTSGPTLLLLGERR